MGGADQDVFAEAMRELDRMDRRAMWDAKVGSAGTTGQAAEAPPESEAEAEPEGKPPTPDALLADFESLLDVSGGDPCAPAPQPSATPGSARRIGASPVDLRPEPALARPPRQELRDLERGRRTPERRIDLHGRSVAEARQLLGYEIAHARERGQHYVLIITGRGLRSPVGARLRPAVVEYLRGPAREHVLWFDGAPSRLGGRGALVVRLRRPR